MLPLLIPTNSRISFQITYCKLGASLSSLGFESSPSKPKSFSSWEFLKMKTCKTMVYNFWWLAHRLLFHCIYCRFRRESIPLVYFAILLPCRSFQCWNETSRLPYVLTKKSVLVQIENEAKASKPMHVFDKVHEDCGVVGAESCGSVLRNKKQISNVKRSIKKEPCVMQILFSQ